MNPLLVKGLLILVAIIVLGVIAIIAGDNEYEDEDVCSLCDGTGIYVSMVGTVDEKEYKCECQEGEE